MTGLMIGAVLGMSAYLLLFRRSGMGCCGGHSEGLSPRNGENDPKDTSDIIDIDKSQYKVVTRR